MSGWDTVKQIWLKNGLNPDTLGTISNEDKEKASVPVSTLNKGWYYGNYCGPGTSIPLSTVPIDCLDLGCKLHDQFFKYVNSDDALSQTASYLLQNNMIAQSQTQEYAKTIDGFLFQAGSNMWRNKWLIIVLFVILIICIGLAIGIIVFKVKKSN